MVKKCYFTFPTTHQAIRAEKVLAKTKREFKMVPVPRKISSSCGVALCCFPGEAESIQAYLENEAVSIEGVYTLEEKISIKLLSFLDKGREKKT